MLVADNFDITASKDTGLDVILKCRYRIFLTTRSRNEKSSLEVNELESDELLASVEHFFTEARQREKVIQIIDLLHGHTFAE